MINNNVKTINCADIVKLLNVFVIFESKIFTSNKKAV